MGKPYFLLVFVFVLLLSHGIRAQKIGVPDNQPKQSAVAILPPPPPQPDFGDAPDTYLTTMESGGPVHWKYGNIIVIKIGELMDTDQSETPGILADGDDINGEADEDAVDASDFNGLSKNSDSFSLNMIYSNSSEENAALYAWIDFDRSGYFDPDEFAMIGGLAPGSGELKVTWTDLIARGVDIVEGLSYVRLRITTEELTSESVGGFSNDGEVEDHALMIGQAVLGVEEERFAAGVKLLPNPVASVLQISSQEPIVKVEVYSITGRKVLEFEEGFESINLSGLEAGLYIVRIEGEKGSVVRKVVKG